MWEQKAKCFDESVQKVLKGTPSSPETSGLLTKVEAPGRRGWGSLLFLHTTYAILWGLTPGRFPALGTHRDTEKPCIQDPSSTPEGPILSNCLFFLAENLHGDSRDTDRSKDICCK